MQSLRTQIETVIRARASAVEGTFEWIQANELVQSLLKRQHEELQARNRAALEAAGRASKDLQDRELQARRVGLKAARRASKA